MTDPSPSLPPPPPLHPPSPRAQWLHGLAQHLEQRREAHLFRELRQVDSGQGPTLILQGREYVQFCTNNYLGLANDPEVIDAAREATARFGTGAGASRLVAGSMQLHHELENALARFKGAEAALVFPTGFMANLAVMTTFAGEGDLVVSDKLNHASLLDGAKFSGALCRTFPHRQYGRAEALLQKELPLGVAVPRKFLVTDSIFSMDGDLANLPAACEVAERAGAMVIVDEAHGTGLLGERGAGLAELQGVEERVALTVGTLSKALGSVGGFVTGPRAAIDTLINAARSFIYTTALPPGCAAASLAALRIVEREPARRHRLMALAGHVKSSLVALGFDCGDSASPIIPILIGQSDAALRAANFLNSRGLYVPAIRPPTVPPNSARLRISLMSTHTDAHIEQLIVNFTALKTQSSSPLS
jgi:8-amino-7-oxononanoate synthase